jgi:hypothetical protein
MADLYFSYKTYISTIDDIRSSQFRRHPSYIDMLEHVSVRLGNMYAALIQQEFPQIPFKHVAAFIVLNDAIGNPYKARVSIGANTFITCAPTSLRYAYHALTILTHLKGTGNRSIVEIGCGYGGLCLAINHFAKLTGIAIDAYHIVDLPEAGRLIGKYLECHKDAVKIPYTIHDASTYGSGIEGADLFLISNYCFTEIDEVHRRQYARTLFGKVTHGFITWQTNSVPLENISVYLPNAMGKIIEEKPQTSGGNKNFFVSF